MNKASQKVYKMLNYYFDNNQSLIKDFCKYGIHTIAYPTLSIQLMPCKELRKKFRPLNKKQENKLFGKDSDLSKEDIKNKQNTIKYFKKNYDKLSKVDPDNLYFFAGGKVMYKELDGSYIIWITDSIPKYLVNNTNAQYKINWILKHKTVSDKEFGYAVNINPSMITKYKRQQLNVNNMKLGQALNIIHYYLLFIGRKTIGYDKTPDKSSIEESGGDPLSKLP